MAGMGRDEERSEKRDVELRKAGTEAECGEGIWNSGTLG
jgi:hypothetical protein